jgi:signal transduction histidine kinase
MVVDQLVANVLEHAAATTITLCVYEQAQHIIVEIGDNGRGFSYYAERGGPETLGILQRQAISASIGGTLTIDSRPGHGTHITLRVPLAATTRRHPTARSTSALPPGT